MLICYAPTSPLLLNKIPLTTAGFLAAAAIIIASAGAVESPEQSEDLENIPQTLSGGVLCARIARNQGFKDQSRERQSLARSSVSPPALEVAMARLVKVPSMSGGL